jgi:hypothetical protein
MSIPSRFLLEIPPELMVGPQLRGAADIGADLDPDIVFRERGSRLGAGIRAGGAAYRQGSGRPGAPLPGESFRPSRDLGAKREAYAAGAPSGSLGRQDAGLPPWDELAPQAPGLEPRRDRGRVPDRPIIPGERRYRDGDRIRHARWGDGIVITSKLTRDDEEVQVAFKDAQVGRKTMLASLANLELIG